MILAIATVATLFLLALTACVSYAIGVDIGWAQCEACAEREYMGSLDAERAERERAADGWYEHEPAHN